MDDGLLGMASICKAFGVSRRTVQRWVAQHGLVARGKSDTGAALYEVSDVEDVMSRRTSRNANGSKGVKVSAARRGQRQPSHPRTARNAPPQVEAAPPDDVEDEERQPRLPLGTDDDLSTLSPDELLDTVRRLRQAEKSTHKRWRDASRNTKAYSESELKVILQSWHDTVERLRRTEKELPEIMAQKRRYVDAVVLGSDLGRAAVMMGAELDQLGASVAELCVGKPAKEIRIIVDQGVAAARKHIVDQIEAFVNSHAV